jgi:PAS domain S-box-containing protein
VPTEAELATWLLIKRAEIERALAARLGGAPEAASPETEALRRFRSFAASSLLRGTVQQPSLDGLRADDRRVNALLGAWSEAAAQVAGSEAESVRRALRPLVARFHGALRATTPARSARGAPRASRRAVLAAIDRVADSFLAVDTESGRIVDANPAAGALLGLARDALLECQAERFFAPGQEELWRTEIDALTEGAEPRRVRASVRDVQGSTIPVEASLTRYATRGRVLALLMLRVV